ncbi:MAG: tetratricopeptide (TPR) repeat protein [Planctomycetota bacterium]|jgi:tetratricopeptide (TPR) repeat protein
MRKEQVVLLLTASLLGYFVYDDLAGTTEMRESRSKKRLEFEPQSVPAVELAIPRERSGRFSRDLFTPPSDTDPLAKLELEAPPLEPLHGLAPPAPWGPSAKAMGDVLRRPVTITPIPSLFLNAEDQLPDPGAGLVNNDPAGANPGFKFESTNLTPEERAEQIAGYKKLYDNIFVANELFGFIRNKDRFGLSLRPDDVILFEQVNPNTGESKFSGQGPIPYERSRISNFAFASTVANEIEETHRLRYYGEIAPSDFTAALDFAGHCVHKRLEAPRALEIGAELYRKIEAIAGGDLRPQLGLARCFESGFQFQAAFDIYRDLLAGDQDKNPVVHARYGSLLARFRMFDKAEVSFQEALRWGRTNWEANWHAGRFMLSRGRSAEAVAFLERSRSSAGGGIETVPERTEMRTDLGWALLQQGDLPAATTAFASALNLTAGHKAAIAGQVSVIAMEEAALNGASSGSSETTASVDAGFELLHARALLDMKNRNWRSAVDGMVAASESDPFRANCAYRALSWMAELTGYPEEAYSFAERAYEVNPTDAYTLYQRGRVFVAREDLEAARDSFQAAIDLELDFADALIALAEIARNSGDADSAERYFERALGIDDDRPLVHTRRGLNQFTLGQVELAEESFSLALAAEPDLASARLGLAWCAYLAGESGEALTLYSDLIESRRNEAEDDAPRAYAQALIERIKEHESKEVWRERFDRRAGTRIGNGWKVDQKHGLQVKLLDGVALIEGQADTKGRTRLFIELPASRFVSAEFELNIKSGRARSGIFLSRERYARGDWEIQSEITLSRSQENVSGYRIIKRGERDVQHEDLGQVEWPSNTPLRVKIERRGESSDSRVFLYVDGIPVLEDAHIASLGTTSASLRFGVFVEADTGRSAELAIDNVSVIRKRQ